MVDMKKEEKGLNSFFFFLEYFERTTCSFVTKRRGWVHIIKVDDCIFCIVIYVWIQTDWQIAWIYMEIGDIWVYEPLFCNNINSLCRCRLFTLIFFRVYLTLFDLQCMQKGNDTFDQ